MDFRHQFVELMDEIAGLQGMTPTASKVLALLIFDGKELSFSDLAKQLGVSRGNVSMNTKALEGCKIITRVRYKGDRQYYFRLSEHLYSSILKTYAVSLTEASEKLKGLSDLLPEDFTEQKLRIERFSILYSFISEAMKEAENKMNK